MLSNVKTIGLIALVFIALVVIDTIIKPKQRKSKSRFEITVYQNGDSVKYEAKKIEYNLTTFQDTICVCWKTKGKKKYKFPINKTSIRLIDSNKTKQFDLQTEF